MTSTTLCTDVSLLTSILTYFFVINYVYLIKLNEHYEQKYVPSPITYSHLSNNRGGWNKRGEWDLLEKTST